MPMPSQFEETKSERLTASACDSKLRTSLLTGVLLLETDLAILTERTRLLSDSNYRVTTARNQSDLFIVRGKTGISLAILSDCLGATALGVAAHSIRLGWPLARILILGKAQFVLEDNLYDEAIDHRFVKAELLSTIAKLCPPSVNRGRDGGLFLSHRGTTETEATTPQERRGDSVNSLTMLPVATGQGQLTSSCAKLIRAAEIECRAFMFATEQLFGGDMALRAGGLWVDALEADSTFRCQESCLRLLTIIAAGRLAELIGATHRIEHSATTGSAVLRN